MSALRVPTLLSVALLTALLSACGGDAPPPAPTPAATSSSASAAPAPAPAAAAQPTLDSLIAGSHRSEADKARDGARHPRETLEFFRLKPTDTVLEVTPGAGWWTDILAPYLRAEGRYIALVWDDTLPDAPKYYAENNAKLKAKLDGNPALYDKVEILRFNPDAPGQLAPAGSVDLVVTFRNTHNWIGDGKAEAMYQGFFDALKPGGRLGVEQHRAAAGSDPAETAKKGYVSEAAVIAIAEKAGFKLLDQSEINANPKDTRDYEKGVWTLPPVLALGDTDKDKYLAIGESDRMTLLFEKPAAAAAPAADSQGQDGFEQKDAATKDGQ